VLRSLDLGGIGGFLLSLYQGEGAGRKPYNPVYTLKSQLLKHLQRIPSDRRLSLLLKRNKRACAHRKTGSNTEKNGKYIIYD
jgi:hypothetical protein